MATKGKGKMPIEQGTGEDVDMLPAPAERDSGRDNAPPGTQSDSGYEVTEDIFAMAFKSPARRPLAPPDPLRSPFSRFPGTSQLGGSSSKWDNNELDFRRRLEAGGVKMTEDEALLERYARSLPSNHPKQNPLRSSTTVQSPSQAPNETATKLGEMAFEHLTMLYNSTNPDSAARSSAALLDAHMSNLMWIQSRLINHYENLVRSRNFIQKSIDAISIAAFTQTRATEFAQMFQAEADTEEDPLDGVVERTSN